MLKAEDIEYYKGVLAEKADLENLSIDEYCNPNTDYVVVEKSGKPIHWGTDLYDFVVFGDKEEAKEYCTEEGDKVIRLTKWLLDNGIVTKARKIVYSLA